MTRDEKRMIRREVIQHHMWIRGNVANLILCVRLYELQFYGQELRVYHVDR